jgi:hypothetical protein
MQLETYYLTGTLHKVYPAKSHSEKFTKQDFLVRQDGEYPQTIRFQVVNTRIPQLLKVEEGDMIEVAFNIKGQMFTNKTTGEEGNNTNLQAFEINRVNHS